MDAEGGRSSALTENRGHELHLTPPRCRAGERRAECSVSSVERKMPPARSSVCGKTALPARRSSRRSPRRPGPRGPPATAHPPLGEHWKFYRKKERSTSDSNQPGHRKRGKENAKVKRNILFFLFLIELKESRLEQ